MANTATKKAGTTKTGTTKTGTAKATKTSAKKIETSNDLVRPFYAGVGVTDRAVEAVREAVAEMSKRVAELQKGMEKSVTEFDALAQTQVVRKDVEKRFDALQTELAALPGKMTALVDDNVTVKLPLSG